LQLWPQNIQDLGICEELVCRDDFNIPDVDLTFQNYEELFGGDQDPIRVMFGGKDVSCSSLEKDLSVDNSDIDWQSKYNGGLNTFSLPLSELIIKVLDRTIIENHQPIRMILSGISFCMTNFEGLKTMSMKNKYYVRKKKVVLIVFLQLLSKEENAIRHELYWH